MKNPTSDEVGFFVVAATKRNVSLRASAHTGVAIPYGGVQQYEHCLSQKLGGDCHVATLLAMTVLV